jgi:transposase
MSTITTVGLDIAKSVFQVQCVDANGNVVLRRQLKRRYVHAFFKAAALSLRDRSVRFIPSLVAAVLP